MANTTDFMTASEFKIIRTEIFDLHDGTGMQAWAEMLGYKRWRTVSEIEHGRGPITPAVSLLVRALVRERLLLKKITSLDRKVKRLERNPDLKGAHPKDLP